MADLFYGPWFAGKVCVNCDFYLTPLDHRNRFAGNVCPECGNALAVKVIRLKSEKRVKRCFLFLKITELVVKGYEVKHD